MLFKSFVKDIRPYVAQAPIERLQAELGVERIYKLASNEGAFGPVPAAVEVLTSEIDDLRRYPDSAAPQLRERIGALSGVDTDQVVLGNGADELIRLSAMTVLERGDNGIFPWPSFPTYVSACTTMGAEPRPIDLDENWQIDFDAMKAAIHASTRIVYIANPNNPTGLLAPRAALREFITALPPHVLCVLDEAYAEYAIGEDEPEGLQMIREGVPNLLVLRTFSKVYGLAGLRVGYGIGSADVAQAVDRMRSIFNVNSQAQAAALVSLDADAEISRRVKHVHEARTRIFQYLALAGHKPLPSRANFVFAEAKDGSGKDVEQRLLKIGVAVRALDGFGAPGAFRVTCGRDEENDYFAAAIDRLANGLA